MEEALMKSNEFVDICFFCAHHDRCVNRKNLGDVRVPRDFKDPTLYCKMFMKNEDDNS